MSSYNDFAVPISGNAFSIPSSVGEVLAKAQETERLRSLFNATAEALRSKGIDPLTCLRSSLASKKKKGRGSGKTRKATVKQDGTFVIEDEAFDSTDED